MTSPEKHMNEILDIRTRRVADAESEIARLEAELAEMRQYAEAARNDLAAIQAEIEPIQTFQERHDAWAGQRDGGRRSHEFPCIPAQNKVKVTDPTANEYVDNGDVLYAIEDERKGTVRIADSSGLSFVVGDSGEFSSHGRRLGWGRVIGALDVASGETVGTFPAKGTFSLWIVK